jgi:hypothetical protein
VSPARTAPAPTRASEGRHAEQVYREQLDTRGGDDFGADSRMKLPPPRQREAIRFGGGTHARGTSGLYDWFYELAPEEQQRLRANWMTPRGYAVDEMEDKLPVTEWLSLTRRIDMARAITKGRHIERKRYGGLDPDKVLTSGRRLGDLKAAAGKGGAGRRPGGKTRAGRSGDSQGSRCHFFTDDDGVVHPIASTCGHVRHITRREVREKYGDDEAF